MNFNALELSDLVYEFYKKGYSLKEVKKQIKKRYKYGL